MKLGVTFLTKSLPRESSGEPLSGPAIAPELQLREAMAKAGIQPPDYITMDGRLHRFASGDKRGVGRHAVIGLAIPCRKLQRLDLGRSEGKRLGEGASALAVPREMNQHDAALLAVARERTGQIGDAKGVEAVRRTRQGERAAFGKFGDGAGDGGQGCDNSVREAPSPRMREKVAEGRMRRRA